jgi:hypothetical protein
MGRLTNNDDIADARIAGVNENNKNMPNFVEKIVFSVNCKGEQANFYLSLEISYPQILGLILISQISKFHRCASPQKSNPGKFL